MNATVTPPATEVQAPKKKKNPKLRKRIILSVIALVVVGAIVFGMVKLMTADDGSVTINDAMVQLGSITSKVEGSGTAKAKSQETITITTSGTVLDVYVTEGQTVEAGQQLFSIDSPGAQAAVVNARDALKAKQQALDDLYEAANNLTVTAPFSGKILLGDSPRFEPGDPISSGTTIAKLVDDHTLTLEQYYSYAYENDIRQGQSVSVSIPAVMGQVTGTVERVNMVERISAEGSRLFMVEISVPNEGALTEGMKASASITSGGQAIYPYEQGELKYSRTADVVVKASGDVISNSLLDYLSVSAGDLLMQIDGEDNEADIYNAEEDVKTAQEDLEKAEKNLANLEAVAPISGTVSGLAISPGQEVDANTAVITIADTSVITITAQVDERNLSYVKVGMMVDINQWGTPYTGVVESISLNAENNNGAVFYPATISVDNSMAAETGSGIYPNSSVTYSLVASQSDGCLVLPIQCVKYVTDPNSETGESISVVFLKTDARPDNAIDIDGSAMGVPAEGYYAVPVETGINDTYNIEIRSGVSEGDTVFQNTTQNMNMYY